MWVRIAYVFSIAFGLCGSRVPECSDQPAENPSCAAREQRRNVGVARYLLAATPIPGHVAPMAAVAADLRRRGHEVCLLTGSVFQEVIRMQDVRFAALPSSATVTPSDPGRGWVPDPLRRWRTGRVEIRSSFLDPIVSQYSALTAELGRTVYDAVLVDVMYTGAIPLLLSGESRPPVLTCGVVPLMAASRDCPPFGLGWQPRPGRDYTTMNRFAHRVLFRSELTRLNAVLRELGVQNMPVPLLDWPVLADRLLQFTVPEFEYPRRDLPSTVVFTGPIPIPALADIALPDWWSALHSGKTVVHVTQGTWTNRDYEQLLRPTLSALSGRDDVVMVACTGGSRAPIGPVPANAHVTDFVPYAKLLPLVDVMVTNGGYGGVQQALGYGVPLVVAGDTADKPEVAARVAYTGAGIDLGTARPRTAAIATAVDRANSSEFRTAAKCLAAAMVARSPFETIAAVLAEVTEHGATRTARSAHRLPSEECHDEHRSF